MSYELALNFFLWCKLTLYLRWTTIQELQLYDFDLYSLFLPSTSILCSMLVDLLLGRSPYCSLLADVVWSSDHTWWWLFSQSRNMSYELALNFFLWCKLTLYLRWTTIQELQLYDFDLYSLFLPSTSILCSMLVDLLLGRSPYCSLLADVVWSSDHTWWWLFSQSRNMSYELALNFFLWCKLTLYLRWTTIQELQLYDFDLYSLFLPSTSILCSMLVDLLLGRSPYCSLLADVVWSSDHTWWWLFSQSRNMSYELALNFFLWCKLTLYLRWTTIQELQLYDFDLYSLFLPSTSILCSMLVDLLLGRSPYCSLLADVVWSSDHTWWWLFSQSRNMSYELALNFFLWCKLTLYLRWTTIQELQLYDFDLYSLFLPSTSILCSMLVDLLLGRSPYCSLLADVVWSSDHTWWWLFSQSRNMSYELALNFFLWCKLTLYLRWTTIQELQLYDFDLYSLFLPSTSILCSMLVDLLLGRSPYCSLLADVVWSSDHTWWWLFSQSRNMSYELALNFFLWCKLTLYLRWTTIQELQLYDFDLYSLFLPSTSILCSMLVDLLLGRSPYCSLLADVVWSSDHTWWWLFSQSRNMSYELALNFFLWCKLTLYLRWTTIQELQLYDFDLYSLFLPSTSILCSMLVDLLLGRSPYCSLLADVVWSSDHTWWWLFSQSRNMSYELALNFFLWCKLTLYLRWTTIQELQLYDFDLYSLFLPSTSILCSMLVDLLLGRSPYCSLLADVVWSSDHTWWWLFSQSRNMSYELALNFFLWCKLTLYLRWTTIQELQLYDFDLYSLFLPSTSILCSMLVDLLLGRSPYCSLLADVVWSSDHTWWWLFSQSRNMSYELALNFFLWCKLTLYLRWTTIQELQLYDFDLYSLFLPSTSILCSMLVDLLLGRSPYCSLLADVVWSSDHTWWWLFSQSRNMSYELALNFFLWCKLTLYLRWTTIQELQLYDFDLYSLFLPSTSILCSMLVDLLLGRSPYCSLLADVVWSSDHTWWWLFSQSRNMSYELALNFFLWCKLTLYLRWTTIQELQLYDFDLYSLFLPSTSILCSMLVDLLLGRSPYCSLLADVVWSSDHTWWWLFSQSRNMSYELALNFFLWCKLTLYLRWTTIQELQLYDFDLYSLFLPSTSILCSMLVVSVFEASAVNWANSEREKAFSFLFYTSKKREVTLNSVKFVQ